MYQLSDYDYDLPAHLIAQTPVSDRTSSRLLVMNRKTGALSHHIFHDMAGMLQSGDVLVVNDTRVIPARLLGHKSTGGKTEILLIDYAGGRQGRRNSRYTFECRCLVRASKKPARGSQIHFEQDLSARIGENHEGGVHTVLFSSPEPFEKALEKQGQMPLPPYIERGGNHLGDALADRTAYQTVYAAKNGAVAAPTAGLHFTPQLLEALEKSGIEICTLTLHVSYGTFMPVRENDIRSHAIHSEHYSVSEKAAKTINRAKSQGRRVVAVGTTSVRTLEYCSDDSGRIVPGSGACDLYIYPGYRFKTVDQIITNFHLPKSTLLMLVSAFAGRDAILNAYRTAIDENYRFYSYGDAMFIG